MIGEVDAVPTVPLIFDPPRLAGDQPVALPRERNRQPARIGADDAGDDIAHKLAMAVAGAGGFGEGAGSEPEPADATPAFDPDKLCPEPS